MIIVQSKQNPNVKSLAPQHHFQWGLGIHTSLTWHLTQATGPTSRSSENCLGINANSTKVLLSVSATCFEWPKRVAQYHNMVFCIGFSSSWRLHPSLKNKMRYITIQNFKPTESCPAFWRMITKRVQTKSDLLQILDLTTWDQKSANHAFWIFLT